MTDRVVTSKQQVRLAIEHKNSDRCPRDFAAEPSVWLRLMEHFGVENKSEVLEKLGVDCRVVSYDFNSFLKDRCNSNELMSAWKNEKADGVKEDIWGACRKRIKNEFADYEDLCEFKLAEAESVEDMKKHDWPKPERWDFSRLNEIIDKVNPDDEYHLRWRMGSIFETSWSLRGFDKFFMDLALNPEMACYIMDRVTEIHIENLRRVMEIAGDRFDMVYLYDDVASQQSLLMSVDMWKETVGARQKKLFSVAKEYGKAVMYHCCGNVVDLIDEFIEMGVDVLNPLQPLAIGIDNKTIKERFGERITFHGGIDIQQLLPGGTVGDVKLAVEDAKKYLGAGGGYILSPAHHVQADTPIENILAIYGLD